MFLYPILVFNSEFSIPNSQFGAVFIQVWPNQTLTYTNRMLSIILPTYNEAKNLPELLKRIVDVMDSTKYEVIVVDDNSPDKTWEIAQGLQKDYSMLRVIRRVGRRGLSSAVLEGFDLATGDVLLVMDSDLQHDPALILKLGNFVARGADIAVASRYMKGGSVGEWVRGRRLLSKTATWIAQIIPPVRVSDPMSGFFALKASDYRLIRPMLRPTGFKILFEILGHLPSSSIAVEVPLVFKMRLYGESKLSFAVQMQFLLQLVRITLLRIQNPFFWLACSIITIVLTMRAMPLMPLYTDAALRSQVQATLRAIADENGWLLSDVRVLQVDGTQMTIVHRAHRKGGDPEPVCYSVEYATSASREIPCVD
jgi:cellulose synthase/poly-beta-1,6-N-acetylglucosamine synthase-like glycosyltransferase